MMLLVMCWIGLGVVSVMMPTEMLLRVVAFGGIGASVGFLAIAFFGDAG